MKLTPELIAQSPSSLNPLKERQLDLRGELKLYLARGNLPDRLCVCMQDIKYQQSRILVLLKYVLVM